MFESAEESAFSKLPTKLQGEFFELAAAAALKISKMLREEGSKLGKLKGLLIFRKIPVETGEGLRVGVVDGSSSPRLSERLGFRIGVYAASYMVFDDDEVISDDDDESMEAGYIMSPQTGSSLHTKKILSLLCTLLERDLALKCMERYDVDLMLIDGSFYGFRTRCSEIKEKRFSDLGIEGVEFRGRRMERGIDLIKDIYDKTVALKHSGKAIGVIKRIRTTAIDGWILSRSWSLENTLNRNDRAILRALMKTGEYFDYADLLEGGWGYLHFSSLRGWFNYVLKVIRDLPEGKKLEKALEYVDKKLYLQIVTDLCPEGCPREFADEAFREVIGAKRIYARFSPYAPPTCIELGDEVDVGWSLSCLGGITNPVTGLPFPLDLVDENISIDRRLASEFADEVESRLLQTPELDADDVYGEFESINPQKEE
ncbi:MAG: DNA double-strand break repair nuclease NurA [Aigarchaeota archaeon]|nr:DNA double-strand break repair nuclease NurA [Aigarchaeota archaeon]MDW8021931.1 DNA double-strand break repair nuclease NurA [Nitrososphaerota archaeon]